ncbi:MAG: HNH endonuclease [Sediminibacterium sp.]
MRNLKAYNIDSFEFYKEIVNKKRNSVKDPTYKTRLATFETNIETLYKQYDDEFATDTLPTLRPHGYRDQDEKDLVSLYSYQNSKMQNLKIALTTNEQNRKVSTCQHCTIGEVNSFDHFVPKGEFAEFSVHPKNLIPSCSKCNSYKSTGWRNNNNRLFLNLYLDTLPDLQYLFVNLTVTDKDVSTTFYLDNRNGIDVKMYTLLEQHYRSLDLFNRFNENIDDVVEELEADMRSGMEKLSFEDAKNVSISSSNKKRTVFGANYWKSILELALLDNQDFRSRFV